MARESRLMQFLNGLYAIGKGVEDTRVGIERALGKAGPEPLEPEGDVIDTIAVEHDPLMTPTRRAALPPAPGATAAVTGRNGMTMRTYNVRSIDERVAFIIRAIKEGREDPDVRQFATDAVSKRCGSRWCTAEGDYLGEIVAMWKALRGRVRYVRDLVHKDLFQSARRTLELGAGDCDDYTSAGGAALNAIGYPVRVRVIQTKKASSFNHVFLMVGVIPTAPTRWIPFDASVPHAPPWQAPERMVKRFRDFDVD